MAPCKSRGTLNILFNLSITVGILIANVINYFTAKIEGVWGWRISLGGAAILAIFVAFAVFFLPDTPESMIDREQPDKARAMLRKILGVNDEEVGDEFNDVMVASKASKEVKNQWRNITERKYMPQLTMSVLIPAFQQHTGTNVVMFYALVLFKTIGFSSDASLMAAIITGIVNVLSTFVPIYAFDKWGRRILFLVCGSIMCVFQIVLATFIRWQFGDSRVVTTVLTIGYPIIVVICICFFVSAFAWSWGLLALLVMWTSILGLNHYKKQDF